MLAHHIVIEEYVLLKGLSCGREEPTDLTTMFDFGIRVYVFNVFVQGAFTGVPLVAIGTLFGDFFGSRLIEMFIFIMELQAMCTLKNFAALIADEMSFRIVYINMTIQTFRGRKSKRKC